jgi:hypothetical protein
MPTSRDLLGQIEGRVGGADGSPIVDAVVMITGDSPGHSDIAALTDAQGRYRFSGLAAGRYTLLVNAAGHRPHSGEVNLQGGAVAQLDFILAS